MKKITLFIALFMAWGVTALNAQTLNNPVVNGNQIYKWDCANNRFATDNNFEIDETVVFAVDVTGTPLEAWLATTPAKPGETRSIGFDFNTQWGGGGCDGRFLKIKGNIYGATMNFAQLITSRYNQLPLLNVGGTGVNAFTIGTAVVLNSNIFGFGFTATDPGAEWWQLPMQGASGANVTTAPYTGTKTSPPFDKADIDPNFFPNSFLDWNGYASACVVIPTDVKNTYVSDSPIVGYEYYNMLGGKLQLRPESGIFIQKAIRQDGTTTATKVFKELK